MKELRQAELGKRKGSYADKNIEHTQHMKKKEKAKNQSLFRIALCQER
jgi:hypothetical protein